MLIDQTDLNGEIEIDDLKNLSTLEAVFKAQREYNALDQEMKIARARRQYTRDRLIAELESRGSDRDGNEHGKVLLMRKTYPKVTDFDALREHVHDLDEPDSAYLKEVFIKGNKRQGIEDPLERLVNRAMLLSLEEGIHISEAMPPGLTVTTDTSVRVTLRKANANELFKAKLENPFGALDEALEE